MSVGRVLGIVIVLVAAGLGVALALGAFVEDPPSITTAAVGATTGTRRRPWKELVENPPPTAPATATQTVVQDLADQCGVVVITE